MADEDIKQLSASTPVNEVTMGQLMGVFVHCLREHSAAHGQAGEVGNLSVKDFEKLMSSCLDSNRFRIAQEEQKITERIFKDTKQLAVAGTSFRVNSKEDLQNLVDNWSQLFDGGPVSRSLVLVAAVLDNGTYRPASGPK